MEPVTVVAALGSVTHLTNIAKSIGSYLKETGKAEAIDKVMDLSSAILELHQKHAELFDENRALKEEIRELKQRRDLRAELKFQHGVYFRYVGGNQIEYYCSVCLDRDNKAVQVPRTNNQLGTTWHCAACGSDHEMPRTAMVDD